MNIHGKNRIGNDISAKGVEKFQAVNPVTNEFIDGVFTAATNKEVDKAVEKAAVAYHSYKKLSSEQRAIFLETIADEILALSDVLIKRASLETALPEPRLVSERGRTVFQLRMFAQHIREGSWVDASIDTADPQRQPFSKPDLRRMLQPVGPVVVFTASNFPLAYSTAGGDTAAALAAGNPVIVKGHPSHPGTNEMVGDAIYRAALKCGLPDGVFSNINACDYAAGIQLVQHPKVCSVGFTGSVQGGMALWKAANERAVPIPVFAEMGSTNPVFLLEGMVKENPLHLAELLANSITQGAGQFCTNPGLMVGLKGEGLNRFGMLLYTEVAKATPSYMLSNGIARNYYHRLKEVLALKGVSLIGDELTLQDDNQGYPHLATVDFSVFQQNPKLHEEVFGPFSLLVQCENMEEMNGMARIIEGQLTASVFAADTDSNKLKELIDILREKAGRLVFNGVPTGVEVCGSMQHGGPFPASTDSRFTSVGTDSIRRFVRPVAWQNAPQELLPPELKNENPLNIWRTVNGTFSKEKINT
jgi:2,5-dioxopentanoate dehydrogenase